MLIENGREDLWNDFKTAEAENEECKQLCKGNSAPRAPHGSF